MPESSPAPLVRPVIHTLLVVLTFLTMVTAGAIDAINGSLRDLWHAPQLLSRGVPYALALLGVLVAREVGYMAAARQHGLAPALPYFIPAPTLFGTLGSFYAPRGGHRKALFDIATAGASSGFVAALLLAVVGVAKSDPVDAGQSAGGSIGTSIAFHWVVRLMRPEATEGLSLHPMAFAGWTGLFITAVGLIPVGQLDGGHILYSLVGARQRALSWAVLAVLTLIGIWCHAHVWILWPLMLTVIGVRHPDVGGEPLGRGRTVIACGMLAILIVTFVLVPVSSGHFWATAPL